MIEKTKALWVKLSYYSFSLLAAMLTFGILLSIDEAQPLTNDKIILLLLGVHLFFFFFIIESSFKPLKPAAITVVVLVELILYGLLTYMGDDFLSAQVFLVLSSIILMGSLKPGSDSEVWLWHNNLIKSALEGVVAAIGFITSLGLIIFLVNFVFDIETPKIIVQTVVKFGLTIVAGAVFIWRMGYERDLTNQFVLNILNFLIVPLWLVYTLLLNIYALRILFSWSLPKGMVVLPVSFSFIFMILCWWGFSREGKSFWSERLIRFALFMHIPLLLLFGLSIGRRIFDYGWTPRRSLMVVYWGFFAEVLYLMLAKKLSARKLAMSFWVSQVLAFIPI